MENSHNKEISTVIYFDKKMPDWFNSMFVTIQEYDK